MPYKYVPFKATIEYMYKCMHYKDTCSSSSRGQKSTCDSQEDFPNYEIWTRCNNPKNGQTNQRALTKRTSQIM